MRITTSRRDELYGLTLKGHIIRRFSHISVVLALFYYLVPETIFKLGSVGVDKKFVLLATFLAVAILELLRLKYKWDFGIFRHYEKYRVSAPFWFSATTAAIILLTPQWFAVPCILCVIIADPVLGELRLSGFKFYPVIGIVICTGAFLIYSYPIIIAVILGLAATLAEIIRLTDIDNNSALFVSGLLDDNFLMQFVPALLIVLIWFVGNQFGFYWLPPDTETLLSPLY